MSESDELTKLADLHQRGRLTDDEFTRAKARVLNGAASAARTSSALDAVNALHRSRDDRWLGGVSGGIASTTGVASWVWRALFTFLALCGGTGLVAYLLLWIFLPLENAAVGVDPRTRSTP